MKYETPEVTAFPAIRAIQTGGKPNPTGIDSEKEVAAAYEDWED